MALPRRIHPAAAPQPHAPWRWGLSGAIAGLLTALLIFPPARWLAAAVAQASEGRLLLQAAEGTAWQGSARLTLSGGAGSQRSVTLPTRLQWRWEWVPGGGLLTLRSSCCTPQPLQALFEPGWRALRVRVLDGPASHWPASMLTGLGAPWNTIAPEGDLELATQGLAWRLGSQERRVSGQARLTAHRLVSRLSMGRALGSYRLTLDGGDPVTLQLQTLDGDLHLTGTGQWLDDRWRFEGQAQAGPGREEAMSNLLNLIGRREGDRSIIRIG